MKALVLAGGLGTRLRARFGDLPKPLVPVGGRPFVERQIAWLEGHRIRDIVLCVGHGAERVREALGDGATLGVTLSYSAEPEPLGTAGALRLASSFVDGPTLVVNGDTLADCDPWALERARWERGAVGALALFEVADATAQGRVECDAQGLVLRFVEKDPRARLGERWRLRLRQGPVELAPRREPGLAGTRRAAPARGGGPAVRAAARRHLL